MLTEEPAGGPPESPRVETAASPPVGPVPRRVPSVSAGPGSAVPLAAQPLQGRRAGLVTRILADSVDFAVVAGILGLAYLGVSAALFIWRSRTFSFPTPSFLLVLVLGGIVSVLYLTATWGTTGPFVRQARPGSARRRPLRAAPHPGSLRESSPLRDLPHRAGLGPRLPAQPFPAGRRPADVGRLRLARRGARICSCRGAGMRLTRRAG